MVTARRGRPEDVEQQRIRELLAIVGAVVYVSGTRRRRGDYPGTMQTPGIPDLCAFLPARPAGRDNVGSRLVLFIEVKAAGGRLRPAQAAFRELCAAAGVRHLVGGVDVVIAFLQAGGWLRAA